MPRTPEELQIELLRAQAKQHTSDAFVGCCLGPLLIFAIMFIAGLIMTFWGGR